ncbi:MAG: GxxExxY protein [bacterium]|nr:GxxExxY protein [bacterium]
MAEDKCIHKELSYEIVGLFFKAHKDLGRFRNEKQYGDYFEKLLQQKKFKYIREYRFNDHQYGKGDVRCIVDFIIENKIIVEFKARDSLTKEDYYQVKRYLVTLNLHLGILVNFRQPRLVPKRILNGLYYKKA